MEELRINGRKYNDPRALIAINNPLYLIRCRKGHKPRITILHLIVRTIFYIKQSSAVAVLLIAGVLPCGWILARIKRNTKGNKIYEMFVLLCFRFLYFSLHRINKCFRNVYIDTYQMIYSLEKHNFFRILKYAFADIPRFERLCR